MKYTTFIGIDVSKKTLDFCVYDGLSKHFLKADNTLNGITKVFSDDVVLSKLKKTKTLFCMEDTGFYNNPITSFLSSKKLHFTVQSALHIKLSLGLVRGKSDRIDAERIAVFASKNKTEISLWEPRRHIINELHHLRSMLVKLKQLSGALTSKATGGKGFYDKSIAEMVLESCKDTREAIDRDIEAINAKIMSLIRSDEKLSRFYDIIVSIRSVGPVLAVTMIVVTNEFKDFPGAPQFACYAGIAPFSRSSGTSLNTRPRVSKFGNREIKSLLHMASMSALRGNSEYRVYYDRKVAEGKHKMAVINAVRNKIVRRIFACVHQDKLYEMK